MKWKRGDVHLQVFTQSAICNIFLLWETIKKKLKADQLNSIVI